LNGNALRFEHLVLQSEHARSRFVDSAHECDRALKDRLQFRFVLDPRLWILVFDNKVSIGDVELQQLSCRQLMIEPVESTILKVSKRIVPGRPR
jgi:hypothetical protein